MLSPIIRQRYESALERQRWADQREARIAAKMVGDAALPRNCSLVDYCIGTVNFRLHEWQLDYKIPMLERMIVEGGQRIIDHAPPQWGKSVLNQRAIAWAIRRDRKIKTAMMAYNIDHASRFGTVIRALLIAEGIVGNVGVERFSTPEREMQADGQSSFMALGMQSGMVGTGPDLLFIDDPFKSVQEAFSTVINDKADDVYKTTVANRISPTASISITCHRYHDDDFVARRMAEFGLDGQPIWKYVRFPAIADENEDGTDPTGRRPGELLSPRQDLSIEKTMIFLSGRKAADPLTFEAQFQGSPLPFQGMLFKREDFMIHPPEECPELDLWIRTYDLATSERESADCTGTALLGSTRRGDIWIRHVTERKSQWPDTVQWMDDQTVADTESGENVAVGIEAFGFHLAAVQDYFTHAASYAVPVYPLTPKGDKMWKARVWASRARQGKVHLVKGDWNEPFIQQCLAFTGREGGKDDMVDSVSLGMHLLYTLTGASPPSGESAKKRNLTDDEIFNLGIQEYLKPS